ncbi:hypothetical protein A2482_00875 [Candidatus Falkowbacteria bacterium RIFOXYC2_FULL_48_21]|uniref:Uncharacterized protein n=1 Tax=Candidatus Falkowbacteria bacterium RIFOXYC2_FULL_48_21 TaxID=1798005 RepID=A0A1F5T6Z4_9BACT|nr:MAG: hypothetical protein A2482_00875 [Candidatus Falkowbacteria bacterium RIFOXYC2_FULL_48_21]
MKKAWSSAGMLVQKNPIWWFVFGLVLSFSWLPGTFFCVQHQDELGLVPFLSVSAINDLCTIYPGFFCFVEFIYQCGKDERSE